MRFLYGLLGVCWLMFGWVCVQSMQWQPALSTPPYVRFELERFDIQAIDQRINEVATQLASHDQMDNDLAELHHTLGRMYWLKAFLQNSRRLQESLLELALEEFEQARSLNPEDIFTLIRMADIYSVHYELEQAEALYLEALEMAKESQERDAEFMIFRRMHYYLNVVPEGQFDFPPGRRFGPPGGFQQVDSSQ